MRQSTGPWLHGIDSHLQAHFTGEELGHARLQVHPRALVLPLRGVADHEMGGLQLRRVLGDHHLNGLMLGDGLTEGLPLLGNT
jgi:hypothetical protein